MKCECEIGYRSCGIINLFVNEDHIPCWALMDSSGHHCKKKKAWKKLPIDGEYKFVIEDTYPARRWKVPQRTCCWWRIHGPCLFWPPSGLSCASSGWGCLPIDWYRRICLEYLEVLYPLTLDRWLDPRRIHHTNKKINKSLD